MEDRITEFGSYLRARGLSERTRRQYVNIVARVRGEPAAWLKKQVDSTTPIGTVLPMRAAIRHYLEFQGADPLTIQASLPAARGRKSSARRALTPEQLERYFAYTETVAEPTQTILKLLPLTGLRISEACGLKREHVQRVDGIPALVFRGKRDVERVVPITGTARSVLAAYLKANRPTSWLFPSPQGGSMTPDNVRRVLREGRDALRLPKLTPHALRHTFATQLLRKGVALKVVQDLMGHSDAKTTLGYQHPDVTLLRDALRQLEP